jgi:26S proteasome regulatory subunit T5
MSTLEDLDDLEREQKEDKKDEKKDGEGDGKDGKKSDGDAEMKDAEPEEEVLDEEILKSSTRDITARKRLLENDMRIMKSEFQRLTHEKATMNDKIKDNQEKIENNRYACSTCPCCGGPVCIQANDFPDNCRISSATWSRYLT